MNCKNCKKQGCSLAGKSHEMSFECKAYVGKTNADRIRAMSDEELAEWITELTDCAVYPYTRKDAPCVSIGQTCAASWLDWLKQEATE